MDSATATNRIIEEIKRAGNYVPARNPAFEARHNDEMAMEFAKSYDGGDYELSEACSFLRDVSVIFADFIEAGW